MDDALIAAVITGASASIGPVLLLSAQGYLQRQRDKRVARETAEAQAAAYNAAMAAQAATEQAALNATKAQEDAAKAQQQALEAARQLVITARESNSKLDQIASVGVATHKIVNNQRTVMLTLVAVQAERIARDNPNDEIAKEAAVNARRDADGARREAEQSVQP
jgi:hypothetical protein